jgi:hypothetical protein
MRGLYGLKSEIKKYIARFEGERIYQIARPLDTSVTTEMPYGICDVTIALRFSLENEGLTL